MKQYSVYILFFVLLLLSSCVGGSKPLPQDDVINGGTGNTVGSTDPVVTGNTNSTKPTPDNTIVARFNDIEITKATYDTAKSEIQLVVEDLNTITLNRDYNRWMTYLSEEYIQTFSDPAHLQRVSASLPIRGVQLRTLRDYFTYVFVPSRQNMRVDDIQFVSPTRVYAIMEIDPKTPVAIYILEKTALGWQIVVKNQ